MHFQIAGDFFRRTLAIGLMIFLGLASACLPTSGAIAQVIFTDRFETPSGQPGPAASIRLLHISPDAPNVDIFVDGNLLVPGLEFLEGTNYIVLPEGTYDLAIAPAGAGIGAAVLSLNDLVLAGESFYTVAAYNVMTSIQALTLEDNWAGIPAGKTRLQVSHTAAGVGTVDVWDLGTGTRLINNFAFGATSQLDLLHGVLQLGLDLDGDSMPDLIFNVPDLGPDTFVNLYAVLDGMGAMLLAQRGDGSTIRINPSP